MKTLSLLTIITAFFVCSANSQTVITATGTYDGNQIWNADTVKITDDVSINGTLTISPGTYIELQGHYEVYANTILALGLPGDSITFTINDTTGFSRPDNPEGGWKGLRADYYMEIDHCRIMFVKSSHLLYIYDDVIDLGRIRNSVLHNNICSYLVGYDRINFSWCYFSRKQIHIHSTSFSNNDFLSLGSTGIIDSCRFIANSIGINGSIGNSYFGRNKALMFSANECSSLNIRYCIFEKNDTLAISCSYLGYLGVASSLFNKNRNTSIFTYDNCNTDIINNTFFKNQMSIRGSFHRILNNIFYPNDNSSHQSSFDANRAINNLFKGGMDTYGYEGSDYAKGNFDLDPQFADTLNNDFHLTAQSPCINNTGVSNFDDYYPLAVSQDLDGNPRINGISADIGAYEFQGTPQNRTPILEINKTPKILPGVPKAITLRFFDPDSGEACSILDVISQTPEVKADVISSDSSSVKINVTANSDWQGSGQILIRITDSHNAVNSFIFRIIATNRVCGWQSPNTVWGGDTVKVECDVFADTLTILPGTTVTFGKNCSMTIRHLLMAIGNDSSKIVFTAADTSGYYKNDYVGWAGIKESGEYNSSKAVFRYCDFLFATTNNEPGGTICWGSENNYLDTLIVTNCNFINNHSQSDGGAIYTKGKANTKAIIKNNRFFNNTSETSGGAIYADSPDIDISNCVFINNSAAYFGGAIYSINYSIVISNCIFADNSAQFGGAIKADYGLKLINNTFTENYAESCGGALDFSNDEVSIINCILWNNSAAETGDEIWHHSRSLKINNSIIKGGLDSVSFSYMDTIINLYSENPTFVNTSLYDFHLSDSSNAINCGIPDTSGLYLSAKDLDNNPRISDLYIDIGAYEYQSDAFKIWKHPQKLKLCYGDEGLLNTNASGGVTGYQWQKNGVDLSGEIYRVLNFPSLDTSQTGNYSCRITSTDNIFFTDTVPVIVDIPVTITRHTEDIIICEEEDTLLVMQTEGGRYNEFSWLKDGVFIESENDSELRFPLLSLYDEGIYHGMVKNSCNSDTTDFIVVLVDPIPHPNLGNDSAFCGLFSLQLSTNATYNKYSWNTGSQDSYIVVDSSGIYWLSVTNDYGCSNTDSILIIAYAPPFVSLGSDTSITTTDSLYLTAGVGYDNYLWNTDNEEPVLLVQQNQPGEYEYWVWAVDTNGCLSGDTVIITVEQATMIKDKLQYAHMKIYPNPTAGLIILVSDVTLVNTIIEIYDIKGRLVFQRKIDHFIPGEQISLNLSVLKPGIYELRAGAMIKKIIKR